MDTLRQDIKFNCDVSDAKYWGYFSICGLLMRYRDLFRSENNLTPWANIEREDIARWIAQKETQWPELEQNGYRDLTVAGKSYHPFDSTGINGAIRSQGLVYGAGYGMYMKPTFFLAELQSTRELSGLTVYLSAREHVRDLLTAPAMLQGNCAYLRREPLSVLLLYKFSELNSKRNQSLEDAFAHYGFRHRQLMDDTFGARLEKLTDQYAEIVLCHELAEFKEGVPEWTDILAAAGDRINEHYLRAVKDLIADTSDLGPIRRIVETRDRGALGLSVSFMEGFQRVLFPELRHAAAEYLRDGDWDVVEKARENGYTRFIAERERIILLYRQSGVDDFGNLLKKTMPV
jgi:hypothetical protein